MVLEGLGRKGNLGDPYTRTGGLDVGNGMAIEADPESICPA